MTKEECVHERAGWRTEQTADEDKLSALHLLINHEAHTFTVNLC